MLTFSESNTSLIGQLGGEEECDGSDLQKRKKKPSLFLPTPFLFLLDLNCKFEKVRTEGGTGLLRFAAVSSAKRVALLSFPTYFLGRQMFF